jgi:hypothetical protein
MIISLLSLEVRETRDEILIHSFTSRFFFLTYQKLSCTYGRPPYKV